MPLNIIQILETVTQVLEYRTFKMKYNVIKYKGHRVSKLKVHPQTPSANFLSGNGNEDGAKGNFIGH